MYENPGDDIDNNEYHRYYSDNNNNSSICGGMGNLNIPTITSSSMMPSSSSGTSTPTLAINTTPPLLSNTAMDDDTGGGKKRTAEESYGQSSSSVQSILATATALAAADESKQAPDLPSTFKWPVILSRYTKETVQWTPEQRYVAFRDGKPDADFGLGSTADAIKCVEMIMCPYAVMLITEGSRFVPTWDQRSEARLRRCGAKRCGGLYFAKARGPVVPNGVIVEVFYVLWRYFLLVILAVPTNLVTPPKLKDPAMFGARVLGYHYESVTSDKAHEKRYCA